MLRPRNKVVTPHQEWVGNRDPPSPALSQGRSVWNGLFDRPHVP